MAILTDKRRRALLSHVQLVEYTMKQLPTTITGKRASASTKMMPAHLALGPARSLYDQLKIMCEITKELLREHVAIDADEAPAEKIRPRKLKTFAETMNVTRGLPERARAPRPRKKK